MQELEFHPAADAFPMMDDKRFDELLADIRTHGQREPITIADGMVLDGRNRYKALTSIGITPRVKDFDGDPWAYAWSLNGVRRDLPQDQKYLIWKHCAEHSAEWIALRDAIGAEGNRKRSNAATVQHEQSNPRAGETMVVAQPVPLPETDAHKSRQAKANAAKVNMGAVHRGDTLLNERPDLAEKVRTGEMTSNAAHKEKNHVHVSANSGNNEWYTPAQYIDAARNAMGGIDLDPASSKIANETVCAEEIYTIDDDGLAQEWAGRVWMNPPYAQPLVGQFCTKLATEVNAGTVEHACVLVNNATETRWFVELCSVATAICFPTGRVKFYCPEGTKGAPLQGQAVVYCGSAPASFFDAFSNVGICARIEK